jgi:DNA-binding CsgD family transcriptional regulator
MISPFPQLSQRERQVCARTLAGWTAKQIGRALGLRTATVLTYRQRAYQRFGFRSASDFLQTLLH